MQVSSQSWPKRMTTRRSSSARIAWSTAHPECKCGNRYDISFSLSLSLYFSIPSFLSFFINPNIPPIQIHMTFKLLLLLLHKKRNYLTQRENDKKKRERKLKWVTDRWWRRERVPQSWSTAQHRKQRGETRNEGMNNNEWHLTWDETRRDGKGRNSIGPAKTAQAQME